MSLDKWQQREVAEHARNNDLSEGEALRELHPEEAPEVPARRTAKAPEAKAPATKAPEAKAPATKAPEQK
ncbi:MULTISPECIES: hypothetical protein [Streptomyces]|uniref:Uncharacterized protein n=1 Tax=Streptomyces pseudovenezuelae TaxID=67350 RepID=A0A117PMG9_9ACTN|nr:MULTISPECIES: hypothetical protein [Streptomyces]KUM82358.1 hypothetical protein AQI94_42020 [Streptomyces pseudovenezuelae]